MPHYKSMFSGDKDANLLYACHLDFHDVTLTIKRVTAGEVTGQGGKKSGKPIVEFSDHTRKWALNKTNGKIIADMLGTPDVSKWIGKRITLYPTNTSFGSEQVECIRVRPTLPPQTGIIGPGAFDLDGAKNAIASCFTQGELDGIKAQLRKAPKAHLPELADLIKAREAWLVDHLAQLEVLRAENREEEEADA